jgi:hypothetical protein
MDKVQNKPNSSVQFNELHIFNACVQLQGRKIFVWFYIMETSLISVSA